MVTATPGGAAATTGTSGEYVLSGLPDGTYTVTPSYSGVPFTPASRSVTVSGSAIKGVDFSDPIPVLKTGTLIYPCLQAICEKDLANGAQKTALVTSATSGGEQPSMVVPMRGGDVAYDGYNMVNGMSWSPLSVYDQTTVLYSGQLTSHCGAATMLRSFDTAATAAAGKMAAFAAPCFYPGEEVHTDIFLVKMDGSEDYIRVTDDADTEHSPVFGSVTENSVTVYYVDTSTHDLMEQVVNTKTAKIVGEPTIFVKGVVDTERALSVNKGYTEIAFVKGVGEIGRAHV